jgi:branched-subunit amino acid ABC-type transport system permease component
MNEMAKKKLGRALRAVTQRHSLLLCQGINEMYKAG